MFVFRLLFVNGVAGILHVTMKLVSQMHFDNGPQVESIEIAWQSESVMHERFIQEICKRNNCMIIIVMRILFFNDSFIYMINRIEI